MQYEVQHHEEGNVFEGSVMEGKYDNVHTLKKKLNRPLNDTFRYDRQNPPLKSNLVRNRTKFVKRYG